MTAKLMGGTPFIFGWAKPVPVNFGNLRHPKRDMIWVAGAGPLANFAMAFFWALLMQATEPAGIWASDALLQMAQIGISINLMLMALNLLPLPPLDGGRIAVGLLPDRAAYALSRVEPYGFLVVLVLIAVPGALWIIVGPIYQACAYLLYRVTGL